jgi:hypothetical protein
MRKLWKYFNGEPFLINPSIISLNPKKEKRKSNPRRKISIMAQARNKFGRFVKRHKKAASNPRRRRRTMKLSNPIRRRARRAYRKNPYFANPKRSHRRRSYRRNPAIISGGGILGLSFKDIGFAGIGFIAPPMIEGLVRGMLPTSLTSNMFGKYAVKGGIVVGLSMLGGKFLGRDAGKFIAIGGTTYLVASILVDFVPSMFGGFSGYMSPGRVFNPDYAQRHRMIKVPQQMRSAPLIGKYQRGMTGTPSQVDVPARLDPRTRF